MKNATVIRSPRLERGESKAKPKAALKSVSGNGGVDYQLATRNAPKLDDAELKQLLTPC